MSSKAETPKSLTPRAMFPYVVGFLMSIALTVIPYLAVTQAWLAGTTLLLALAGFAVAQLLVQLFFFLHLGRGADARWNVVVFLFTVLVILIVVVGSVWIMTSLNYNMMMSPEEMDALMKAEAQKGF